MSSEILIIDDNVDIRNILNDLIKDAKSLEDSGAFAIVLECIYSDIAKKYLKL